MRAKAADETLRDNTLQRRSQLVRRHAHVDQTRCDGEGSVRVDRSKHEVTGHGGLHGHSGGFSVADFTDKDYVRVMAQKRTQAGGKRQADTCLYLGLRYVLEMALDRVLDAEDLLAGAFERVE